MNGPKDSSKDDDERGPSTGSDGKSIERGHDIDLSDEAMGFDHSDTTES
jgi:hypothetical protein